MNLQQEREESAKRMEVVKESLEYPSYEEFRADVIDAYKEARKTIGEEWSVEGAKSALEKIEFLAHIVPDNDEEALESIADDWAAIAVVIDYLLTKDQQDD